MNKKFKYDVIIEKYLDIYPELADNKTSLARKIIVSEGLPFNEDYFRRFIRSYMDRQRNLEKKKDEKIVIPYNSKTFKDDPKYQIANQKYIWESKHGTFSIPIEDADNLFYEYSKHGLDLSSTAVRMKHDIPLKMWFSLKYHLGLYKDSHIISPYTLEKTPQDQLRALINERMMAKEKDKERVIVEEHNKATIAEYNKLIRNLKTKDLAIEHMLDNLSETLDVQSVETKVFSPISSDEYRHQHIVVAIADLHIGSQTKDLLKTPEFNIAVLTERLYAIATKINELNAAKVSILFLGDIIESITGLNHISTWQHIEDGMYGARVFKAAVETIIGFLNKINNVVEVYGISGNHDRMTPDRKADPYNSVAEMIFYTIAKIYEGRSPIKINFHFMLESIPIDGINYIISHGDKNVFKKKDLGTESVLTYGNPTMFNVVLTAHLHSRAIIADHSVYRWIQVPSVFSGDTYSEMNSFFALPGFVVIENSGGRPIVTDYSI